LKIICRRAADAELQRFCHKPNITATEAGRKAQACSVLLQRQEPLSELAAVAAMKPCWHVFFRILD
jgi:hypothetical protein